MTENESPEESSVEFERKHATLKDLGELFAEKADLWRYLIRTKLNITDSDLVEDILSEGMIRCCDRIEYYEGRNGASLSSFVWVVIRNTGINYLRQRDGILRGSNNECSVFPRGGDPDDDSLTFDELVYRQALSTDDFVQNYENELAMDMFLEEIDKILNKYVNERDRKIFKDRVFESHSYNQVCEDNNVEYALARVIVWTVRKTLKEHLPEHILDLFDLDFNVEEEENA